MSAAVIIVIVVVGLVSYAAGSNDGYVKGFRDGAFLHDRSVKQDDEGKR